MNLFQTLISDIYVNCNLLVYFVLKPKAVSVPNAFKLVFYYSVATCKEKCNKNTSNTTENNILITMNLKANRTKLASFNIST